MRIFVLHTVAPPLTGAILYFLLLGGAAYQSWGPRIAFGLCAVWCLLGARFVLKGRVTWFAVGLSAVVPLAAVALLLGAPGTTAAMLLGVGLNVMYGLAKIRCVFLGCCNVPRSISDPQSRLRELHLGRVEASVSFALIAVAVSPLTFAPPLIVAHGVVRTAADFLRNPQVFTNPRRALRPLMFLAAMLLAQIALRWNLGLLR